MNILFLTSSLGAGGAERVATTLCNAWSARGDRVILVPTFSGGGKPFYGVSNEVELIYLAELAGVGNKSLLSYVRRFFALRNLITSRKPDVIISFLPNVNVAAITSSAFTKIPLIICERTDPSICPIPKFWQFVCRLVYRYADLLVVQTEAVAERVNQIYPALKRVCNIPNPLPPEVINHKKTSEIKQRKLLISLGRLSDEKQINLIVEAFAKVAPLFEDWDLNIYGEGPLRSDIEKQICDIGVEHRVFLMGRTIQPWETMMGADIFILTSKYEGFPNALLEAMGVGLPCIAFNCPSGPEEITCNGKVAILVPLNDMNGLLLALKRLMSDPEIRERLGQQARISVIDRFNLNAILDHWDRAFREVGVKRGTIKNMKGCL